jgi:hypothetical protein
LQETLALTAGRHEVANHATTDTVISAFKFSSPK